MKSLLRFSFDRGANRSAQSEADWTLLNSDRLRKHSQLSNSASSLFPFTVLTANSHSPGECPHPPNTLLALKRHPEQTWPAAPPQPRLPRLLLFLSPESAFPPSDPITQQAPLPAQGRRQLSAPFSPPLCLVLIPFCHHPPATLSLAISLPVFGAGVHSLNPAAAARFGRGVTLTRRIGLWY